VQWSARSQATIQAHALADIYMNWQTHCFRQCRTSPVAGVRGYAAASGPRQSDERVSGAELAFEDVSGTDPLRVQAAEVFAADVAAGCLPSIRAIRSRLHVGQPCAQQVRAYLAALDDGC
jgi:hypothetical protein